MATKAKTKKKSTKELKGDLLIAMIDAQVYSEITRDYCSAKQKPTAEKAVRSISKARRILESLRVI